MLPRSVDLSVDVPLPGNQGMQGSCVGWAVAYALKSYHERIERGWVLNDHRHVMSPAYLYNQIKVPGPGGGAYIPDAFEVLMEQGVSSWSLMPYSQYDDDIQPSAAARAEAADYKIAEWGAVLRSGDFVGELKRHLADGSPIVLAIPVYSDFLQLGNDNRIYDDSGGALYGYHAVTVVGYDDAWSAFEIINSWGTGWGLRGYGWIDYDAVSWAILEAYVARDVLELPDDEPPEAVSDPSPANGAAGVAVDTPLSWTRNARTTSFDVYLGLTPTLTATDLQSTVALPTFSPTLARGATYYWRVDANGAGGTTAGPVWSFTTVEPEPPPDPPEPEPDPPVIIKHPAPITFSSPSAAAQTRTLSDYIRGATSYEVQASPAGIVTTRVAGHTLNVTPAAVGAATVRIQRDERRRQLPVAVHERHGDGASAAGAAHDPQSTGGDDLRIARRSRADGPVDSPRQRSDQLPCNGHAGRRGAVHDHGRSADGHSLGGRQCRADSDRSQRQRSRESVHDSPGKRAASPATCCPRIVDCRCSYR